PNGADVRIFLRRASFSIHSFISRYAGVRHGATNPLRIDRFGFGITLSRSSSTVRPKPSHSGHAPIGLFDENSAVVGSANAVAQREQLKRRSKSIAPALCILPLPLLRSTRTARARPPPR